LLASIPVDRDVDPGIIDEDIDDDRRPQRVRLNSLEHDESIDLDSWPVRWICDILDDGEVLVGGEGDIELPSVSGSSIIKASSSLKMVSQSSMYLKDKRYSSQSNVTRRLMKAQRVLTHPIHDACYEKMNNEMELERWNQTCWRFGRLECKPNCGVRNQRWRQHKTGFLLAHTYRLVTTAYAVDVWAPM